MFKMTTQPTKSEAIIEMVSNGYGVDKNNGQTEGWLYYRNEDGYATAMKIDGEWLITYNND